MEVPVAVADASQRVRRRVTMTVFAAAAFGATAFIAAFTISPLIAVEMTGSATLSGLPPAAGIGGTALGAPLVSRVMAVRGRRAGLLAGYGVGVAGALLAVAATITGIFPLLVIGMIGVGCGNSASQLARYAAADVHPQHRRTAVLGWVVWAGTVGAVAGPGLISPAGAVMKSVVLPELAGGLAVTVGGFLAAAVASFVLPRLPLRADDIAGEQDRGGWALANLSTVVKVGLAAMIAGQFVMALIMATTPVHVRGGGGGLGAIGFIMSSHVLGMYAFTPVAGMLATRLGNVAVIAMGLVFLAASGLLAAVAPGHNTVALAAALFLLGLGWSFGFVAGSGLLARGASDRRHARVQGAADSLVFAVAAVASVSSGVLVSLVGYPALGLTGMVLVTLPAVALVRHRKVVAAAGTT